MPFERGMMASDSNLDNLAIAAFVVVMTVALSSLSLSLALDLLVSLLSVVVRFSF